MLSTDPGPQIAPQQANKLDEYERVCCDTGFLGGLTSRFCSGLFVALFLLFVSAAEGPKSLGRRAIHATMQLATYYAP